MKYYLYIDECGDQNLSNLSEVNLAYETIKHNIYSKDGKQLGLIVFPKEH